MHNAHFHIDDITKIEGHATLDVKVRNRKVEHAKFRITENKRFFEQLVTGRHYDEIPGIVARICGFCSEAHLITALYAAENAFRVEPSEQTLALRELLTYAGFLKSHSLHLFFLALPDYLNRESALSFTKKEHRHVHQAMRLKRAGTEMMQRIGGRALHMLSLRVGGFSQLPTQQDAYALLELLESTRKDAEDAVRLFSRFEPPAGYENPTTYLALTGKGYCLGCGFVRSSTGVSFSPSKYCNYLREREVGYSTAKEAEFQGGNFMTGALARVNLNHNALARPVRSLMKELRIKFPQYTPFANNLAQAIELLQCVEASSAVLSRLKIRNEPLPKVRPRAATGYGLTEAPRGMLYHEYKFDKSGTARQANIIVPTSQNSAAIERDVKEFLPLVLNKPKDKIILDLEKLVRAYDPCISCATHFLRVNWR